MERFKYNICSCQRKETKRKMKPQKLCHLNKQNQTLHEFNSLKYSMKLSTQKSPTPTINYANQSQSRCMWGVIQLPEYLQTQQTKAQHAKYSKWMVSHTLCNNRGARTNQNFSSESMFSRKYMHWKQNLLFPVQKKRRSIQSWSHWSEIFPKDAFAFKRIDLPVSSCQIHFFFSFYSCHFCLRHF